MKEELKSEIRMAIGHASMCWNPIPSGIFDEQEANKVADNLIKVLDESPSDSEAVEFHEWVGKQGYKLSHYEAKGGAIHLHESAGSKPFYELKPGDWLTTKELYQIFKSTPCTTNKHQ